MSKPLKIEELKALKRGDWVWVVDNETPQYTGYYKIDLFAISHLHLVQGRGKAIIPLSTYGENWLAYKNKEQAEGKDDLAERIEKAYEHNVAECNKIEQVRKEVAKEILQELKNAYGDIFTIKAIKHIAKQYGVEVDE